MTVVRGAAARRLAVRTHALHLQPPQPRLRAPATSRAAAGAALPSTYHLVCAGSRDGHEDSDHDPSDGHVHAPTPAAAVVTAGPAAAAPAESRPGHLGAVHWTLACSARHLRVAGGLPPLQRKELSELLLPWHGVTDTGRVLDSVTRVTAALCGAGSGGSLRLSATTGHLLVELTGPDSISPPAGSDRRDAASLAGAHSSGRHHTFGEARSRQVHWAAIALPEPRPLPAGIATPAATPTAEPGDDWA